MRELDESFILGVATDLFGKKAVFGCEDNSEWKSDSELGTGVGASIQLKYAPLGLSGSVGLRVFCLESPSTTKDGFLCQLKLKYEKNKKVLSIRIRNPTTLSFEF